MVVLLHGDHQDQPPLEIDLEMPQVRSDGHVADFPTAQPLHRRHDASQPRQVRRIHRLPPLLHDSGRRAKPAPRGRPISA